METGKTGNYFKYAVGEIILLVVGILIALQINTWNADRILRMQASPIAHEHNSAWVKAPCAAILGDSLRHSELE